MAGWYILLVLTGIFFLAVQFVLLPKILVRLRYGAIPPRGRGRETLRESDGKSVLYDAPSDVSHVIPQYTLSERNGEKRLQCRVSANVRAVSYDVALFNGYGEVFKVLNVRKDAVHSGYAGEIALPPETEYISIYLPAAKGVRRGISAPSGKIPKVRFLIYITVFVLSVFLSVCLMSISVAHIFGGLYAEGFLWMSGYFGSVLSTSLVVVAADILFALILFKVKNRKRRRDGHAKH